jgi:hypothetical protein
MMNQHAATPIPANELLAPAYGGPQRDAINSVVDNLVGDICEEIDALRLTLDEIKQQVLEGAAKAKVHLAEQVDICASVKDEIARAKRVAADIGERGKAIL